MQYLSIVRKAEFIDLFKYGHIYVRKVTSFEGDIENLQFNEALFNAVTSEMNIFEYSFEYLMLHFGIDEDVQCNVKIELQDILGAYVFDEDAKKEMNNSFDPRIQIQVSNWSNLFKQKQLNLLKEQNLRGIENLWKILDLEVGDCEKCNEIITNEIVSETFRELYKDERPNGEVSPWIYLLRYERHSLYPKSMKGYFCDFIHVYLNWRKNTELLDEVADSTNLYTLLDEDKFVTSVNAIEKSPSAAIFTEAIPGCRFYIVAPLFLYLKSLSGNEFKLTKDVENIINYSKKNYGFDFILAIYLLGLTLGYDGTYDCLYDNVDFPILKQSRLSQNEVSKPDPIETLGELDLFSYQELPIENIERKIHIHNNKRKNNRKELWVSENELQSYLNLGWKTYKQKKK